MDNAIGFSKIYPLHGAIQRLKNQGLDSRPRLGIRTNSIETTSFQVRWELFSSDFERVFGYVVFYPNKLFNDAKG